MSTFGICNPENNFVLTVLRNKDMCEIKTLLLEI